jgi:DNA-directed RNA polymerase subunit RPC12/RpoP
VSAASDKESGRAPRDAAGAAGQDRLVMKPFSRRSSWRARHAPARCADCGRRIELRLSACRHCGGTKRVRPRRPGLLWTLGAVGSLALALSTLPLRKLRERRNRATGRS